MAHPEEFADALSTLYAAQAAAMTQEHTEHTEPIEEPPALTLMEFADAARATATYPESGTGSILALIYVALGITGEAGEVSDALKKVLRDDDMLLTTTSRQKMLDEAGDVLWYVSRVAEELGSDLESVALRNIAKLRDRAHRGVLGGSGDNR